MGKLSIEAFELGATNTETGEIYALWLLCDQHRKLARSTLSCYCAPKTKNWRDQCASVIVRPTQKTGETNALLLLCDQHRKLARSTRICYCVTNTENWRDHQVPSLCACNPHKTWREFCNRETWQRPLRAKFFRPCMHSDSCLSIKCCPIVTRDDNVSLWVCCLCFRCHSYRPSRTFIQGPRVKYNILGVPGVSRAFPQLFSPQ